MRKVKAICIYRDNKVYNLTALLKDTEVTLIHYDQEDEIPYQYDTFRDLYMSVLGVLKGNNMYCGHYTEFNREWYDISFIDLDNPTEISKYSI